MGNLNLQNLEQDPDRALFSGEISGIIATFYANERPLAGLAGLMDWRFHGIISQYLRQGVITGQIGECCYFPVRRNEVTHHLILVGAGHSDSAGKRVPIPSEAWTSLKKNLSALQLPKIGLSRADLGGLSNKELTEKLSGTTKGLSLWIAH